MNEAAIPRGQTDSHPTNEEIIKAAREYGREHVTGTVFEAFAKGAGWARRVSRVREELQAKFIRAGPRHCPTCGANMWDAGDAKAP